VTRARSGRPAGVAVAGPRMSRRRPGRSLPCPPRPVHRGMSVQPVERTSSIQVSGVQASGASRCPAGQALVSAALPPPWPHAGPRVARWRAAPAGRSGSTCRRGPRAAWLPACIGPDGKGMVRRWPWLACTRVDAAQGRRLAGRSGCGAALAQRADTGAGPGPGCRPGGGEHGTEQVPTGPRRASWWAGRRRGARPWAWTKRCDHAEWSLGEGGPVASSSGGPTRFGGGAACGRAAAAAREERCPLGADRSLTSENSGGRDRV
jgi:hypothetical protein